MDSSKDNLRGAFYMMAAMSSFTINDAFMKSLASDMPLFQALFIRSLLVVFFLTCLAQHKGALRLPARRSDTWRVLLRSVVEAGAAFCFLTALFNMPIANVSAIIQALPLTVTLAAALFLAEPIGWRRLAAIVVGFCGVMLIIRPGSDGFSIYSLYVLAAVFLVTIRDLVVRRMATDVSSIMIALAAAVGVGIFSGFGALTLDWQPMSAFAWFALGGSTLFVIGGYIFSVEAMRFGEIGAVAPFRYTSLLVAIALGWLFFNEWPDALTLLGSIIVVSTGLFTLYRERRRA